MSKVKIKVTQADIDDGIRISGVDCPIARAIRRQLGKEFSVGGRTVAAGVGMSSRFTDLPRSAQRFIRRFDSCKPVQPFNFMLEVPECD